MDEAKIRAALAAIRDTQSLESDRTYIIRDTRDKTFLKLGSFLWTNRQADAFQFSAVADASRIANMLPSAPRRTLMIVVRPGRSAGSTDPLIRAARKARAASPIGKLEALQAEQTKWRRRKTIADNKLAEVQAEIETLCKELAQKASGTGAA